MDKEYSLWSNYKYTYKHLLKYNKILVWLTLSTIILNGIRPLFIAFLPSIIAAILENNAMITQLMTTCFVSFIIAGFIFALANYLENIERTAFIKIRSVKWFQLFWFLLFSCLSHPTLCDPMDCSMPGLPVLY